MLEPTRLGWASVLSIPDSISKALTGPLSRLRRHKPIQAILLAPDVNQRLLDAQAEVAQIRRQAIRQLRGEGWRLKDIAEATGLSEQRIYQLEIGQDRRDRQ